MSQNKDINKNTSFKFLAFRHKGTQNYDTNVFDIIDTEHSLFLPSGLDAALQGFISILFVYFYHQIFPCLCTEATLMLMHAFLFIVELVNYYELDVKVCQL